MLIRTKYWVFISALILISSCKQGECNLPSDQTNTTNVGFLTSVSASWLPTSFPSNYIFKNNLGISYLLTKDALQGGNDERQYNTVNNKTDCGTYKVTYIENDPIQFINFNPNTQPNFIHQYSRTIYSAYQGYMNMNPSMKPSSPYEILTASFISSFASYTFIVPLGGIKNQLTNYTYSDSITLAGKQFKSVYHIYSDSSIYNPNNIVVWGVYYNLNDGIEGYYLSNGELWTRQ